MSVLNESAYTKQNPCLISVCRNQECSSEASYGDKDYAHAQEHFTHNQEAVHWSTAWAQAQARIIRKISGKERSHCDRELLRHSLSAMQELYFVVAIMSPYYYAQRVI
jgi:hypothetical protein